MGVVCTKPSSVNALAPQTLEALADEAPGSPSVPHKSLSGGEGEGVPGEASKLGRTSPSLRKGPGQQLQQGEPTSPTSRAVSELNKTANVLEVSNLGQSFEVLDVEEHHDKPAQPGTPDLAEGAPSQQAGRGLANSLSDGTQSATGGSPQEPSGNPQGQRPSHNGAACTSAAGTHSHAGSTQHSQAGVGGHERMSMESLITADHIDTSMGWVRQSVSSARSSLDHPGAHRPSPPAGQRISGPGAASNGRALREPGQPAVFLRSPQRLPQPERAMGGIGSSPQHHVPLQGGAAEVLVIHHEDGPGSMESVPPELSGAGSTNVGGQGGEAAGSQEQGQWASARVPEPPGETSSVPSTAHPRHTIPASNSSVSMAQSEGALVRRPSTHRAEQSDMQGPLVPPATAPASTGASAPGHASPPHPHQPMPAPPVHGGQGYITAGQQQPAHMQPCPPGMPHHGQAPAPGHVHGPSPKKKKGGGRGGGSSIRNASRFIMNTTGGSVSGDVLGLPTSRYPAPKPHLQHPPEHLAPGSSARPSQNGAAEGSMRSGWGAHPNDSFHSSRASEIGDPLDVSELSASLPPSNFGTRHTSRVTDFRDVLANREQLFAGMEPGAAAEAMEELLRAELTQASVASSRCSGSQLGGGQYPMGVSGYSQLGGSRQSTSSGAAGPVQTSLLGSNRATAGSLHSGLTVRGNFSGSGAAPVAGAGGAMLLNSSGVSSMGMPSQHHTSRHSNLAPHSRSGSYTGQQGRGAPLAASSGYAAAAAYDAGLLGFSIAGAHSRLAPMLDAHCEVDEEGLDDDARSPVRMASRSRQPTCSGPGLSGGEPVGVRGSSGGGASMAPGLVRSGSAGGGSGSSTPRAQSARQHADEEAGALPSTPAAAIAAAAAAAGSRAQSPAVSPASVGAAVGGPPSPAAATVASPVLSPTSPPSASSVLTSPPSELPPKPPLPPGGPGAPPPSSLLAGGDGTRRRNSVSMAADVSGGLSGSVGGAGTLRSVRNQHLMDSGFGREMDATGTSFYTATTDTEARFLSIQSRLAKSPEGSRGRYDPYRTRSSEASEDRFQAPTPEALARIQEMLPPSRLATADKYAGAANAQASGILPAGFAKGLPTLPESPLSTNVMLWDAGDPPPAMAAAAGAAGGLQQGPGGYVPPGPSPMRRSTSSSSAHMAQAAAQARQEGSSGGGGATGYGQEVQRRPSLLPPLAGGSGGGGANGPSAAINHASEDEEIPEEDLGSSAAASPTTDITRAAPHSHSSFGGRDVDAGWSSRGGHLPVLVGLG